MKLLQSLRRVAAKLDTPATFWVIVMLFIVVFTEAFIVAMLGSVGPWLFLAALIFSGLIYFYYA